MPDISLQEFIAQAQRGLLSRVYGPDYLLKQTYLNVSNVFTDTYGRKVWDALNNRTVTWNAIPKVAWGPTTGWRNRTDRGAGRSRPVTETGTLPTIDVSNYVGIFSQPRIVATDFGVSIKNIFTSTLEGGIGDVLAVEQEASQRDHIKEINLELMAGTSYLISNGAKTNFVVPASIGAHFKVGDRVGFTRAGTEQDAGETFTVLSVSAGTVTTDSHTTAMADGDGVFIKSRAGFTSLDDICHEAAAAVGGVNMGTTGSLVYNLTTRTAGTYAAGAVVDYNSGVSRNLQLAHIDGAIQSIRQNGGEPKLMIMGHDQYFKLEGLLQAQQRFMGYEEFQMGVGDERTLPGTKVGMQLATYMGIPILPDADTPKSVATDDTVLGSNIYVLDTDYLELAVAIPTMYVENRDFFAATAMVVRGLLYTMGELRCKNIFVQAKIADLAA